MSMIHILPPEIANKIAAGEVVERPASVVRELIDNAIDAGARRIDITIEEGGLKSIAVADDGSGMSPDDLQLCVKRHATSKIHTAADLEAIATKGFRGEALAAICAVAKVEIQTRRAEEPLGSLLQVNGGIEDPLRQTGAAVGTTVRIRDLFFNTPARKKFLKKGATEMGHVAATVTWNALAHEAVHFTFAHNGRRSMDLPAVNSRVERIQQLFGKDIVKDLLPVQFDSPVVSITGFISRPTLTRNNAQQIYFFVNDRYIKNRVLHTAMINGYRNLLPTRRYPVVFLYFDIDPTEIDINVHPTKQEVKFSREDALYSATYGAIRDTWDTREEAKQETQQIFDDLKKEPAPARPWPKSVRDEKRASDLARRPPEVLSLPPAGPVQNPVPLPPRQDPPRTVDQNPVAGPKPAAPGQPPRGTGDPLPPGSAPAPVQDTPTAPPPQAIPAPRAMAEPTQALDAMIHSPKQDALFEVKSIEDEGQLKVVGQLMKSYILAEGRGGLFIIDQHAAHERLKFEEFLIQSQKARLASQDLLFPLTLDFTPAEAAILDESLTILAQLGFEIEAFGPRTYLVRSLPASLQFEAAEEFIKDILGEIQNEGSVQEKKERALHTLACKAAVKFGDPLRHEDMEAILRGLEKIPRRNVCPHGRPVVLHVSDDQLRTLFKRTGF